MTVASSSWADACLRFGSGPGRLEGRLGRAAFRSGIVASSSSAEALVQPTLARLGRRLGFAAILAGPLLAAGPAKADLRLCNMTPSRVGVALGYRDAQGWVTEGWWNLNARACETLLKGPLAARFYYVHAVDYDRGGEWSGRSFMCTRDREFTIRGAEDCLARGYDRSGFFEVDTGEQKSWTIQLTDADRPGGQ